MDYFNFCEKIGTYYGNFSLQDNQETLLLGKTIDRVVAKVFEKLVIYPSKDVELKSDISPEDAALGYKELPQDEVLGIRARLSKKMPQVIFS